ncbi:PLDc N-terminal domain-containing protein [Demequina sp.]|uniref:PLDc N-terminal domain-containing protein n=1 Tax=Demequina sp. TaxID=2050685 RepID=UPI003A8C6B33
MEPTPLVPSSYDVLWVVLTLAALGMLIAGIVRWARVRADSQSVQLGWFLVMLVVPVIGPAAFLAASRTWDRRVRPSLT